MRGNIKCEKCRGRGVVRTQYGYATCICVRGTAAQRAIQREYNKPLPKGKTN